ncbi:N-acetylneuraminate synthase family protein [Candidatus Thioglobus sp.]|nr:N-acetylneuraminate synthase family protein [Candidatus Thioglobus sp.]
MIDECVELGVGAVKFQSYKASKLAAEESPAYWDQTKETTSSQKKLFSKYDVFGIKEFVELAQYCKENKIEFMSTPFDTEYVWELNGYVKRFKVASVDCTNHILLKEIARTKKPVIMSVGATTLAEIEASVQLLFSYGTTELTLLHCIVNYPTTFSNAGLAHIRTLKEKFPDCKIGYSDHTVPEESHLVLLAAIANGADVIEKHYTFNRKLPGNDHYHAFEKNDLAGFAASLTIWNGCQDKQDLEIQQNSIRYARRGLYANRNIKSGEVLSLADVLPLRPLLDYLPANDLGNILGAKALIDIERGIGIRAEDIVK